MKVLMMKPQIGEPQEAIRITKDMIGSVLTNTETLKQEIVENEDGKLVLKAHQIENNEIFKSVEDIEIFIELNDVLIKTPKGYQKPVNKVYEVDTALERAINKINKIK